MSLVRSRMFGSILLILALWLTACSRETPSESTAPVPSTEEPPSAPDTEDRVPPYHSDLEFARPFPETLSPEKFADYPIVEHAYRVAGNIPEVLAQQPCYCYCDVRGHGSLLDCYATDHGGG